MAYKILHLATSLYLVCLSQNAVRLVDKPQAGQSDLWTVTEIAELGGSSICCEALDACLTIATDTNPAPLEILTVRNKTNRPGRMFLWKIDNKAKTVSTKDGEFYWDVQFERYVNKMPVELSEKKNNQNQHFEFVNVN